MTPVQKPKSLLLFPAIGLVVAALLGLSSFVGFKEFLRAINQPSEIVAERKELDQARYDKVNKEFWELGGGNTTTRQRYLKGELTRIVESISEKGDYSDAVASARNTGLIVGVISAVGCLFFTFVSVRFSLSFLRKEN